MLRLKLGIMLSIFASVSLANDYQDWINSQQQQYKQYKKSMDDEFSDMLKKDWKTFQLMSTPSPYKDPKPLKLPKLQKPISIQKDEIINSPIIDIEPIKKTVIVKPVQVKKEIEKKENLSNLVFDFYSSNITIQYDKNTDFTLQKIDKNNISNFWEMMSKTNFTLLLDQIQNEKENLNLNDWATYQLIHKLGMAIFKENNNANLFTWFVLIKMNYDTKVGYNKDKIYLMSTIENNLFQVSFFTLKNKKYYILRADGQTQKIGTLYTYSGDYPKAINKLSFNIYNELKFFKNLETKNLTFNYNNEKYIIQTQYSQDLVKFYKSFPQTDYNVYFKTKSSTPFSNSILVKIAPLIKGKSEIEAVNLLLRFVQTSFKYKTDQDQFDYEKVMFPEETVNYPYSDCEDRSILFSYLVKNLLKLDVVAVKYSDHLATAVALSSKISGDSFNYKNTQYTIADATYINANAGTSMPKYKNSRFKIIDFQ